MTFGIHARTEKPLVKIRSKTGRTVLYRRTGMPIQMPNQFFSGASKINSVKHEGFIRSGLCWLLAYKSEARIFDESHSQTL